MRFTTEQLGEMSFDELKEHLRLANVNREEYSECKGAMLEEMASRSPIRSYRCAKCEHAKYELREIRVAPGLFSAIADWDIAKYTAVVCARCKHTEFYHGDVSDAEFVVETIFGS
jgi:predicted nucleic-acid-binding Zn-ribbon protein